MSCETASAADVAWAQAQAAAAAATGAGEEEEEEESGEEKVNKAIAIAASRRRAPERRPFSPSTHSQAAREGKREKLAKSLCS